VVELLEKKCLSVLLYGLEVCPLSSSHLKSLNYAVVSSFKKIFVSSTETAKECMFMFGCQDISIMIEKGKENFYRNWLCQTVLFRLYVKSLCQGIYHILFDNMDSWHIVPYVRIACVFMSVRLCA